MFTRDLSRIARVTFGQGQPEVLSQVIAQARGYSAAVLNSSSFCAIMVRSVIYLFFIIGAAWLSSMFIASRAAMFAPKDLTGLGWKQCGRYGWWKHAAASSGIACKLPTTPLHLDIIWTKLLGEWWRDGARDWQADQCSVCSNVDSARIRCGKSLC